MHLNSVDPDGTISLRDAPFTLCGNRGPIDHDGKVNKPFQGHRWIYCVTGALRHPEEFMDGQSVTDLFFLDEATALSAGHRPCHQCNRARANQFDLAWASADLGSASPVDPIDRRLMSDRLTPTRSKKTFAADVDTLPVGTIIRLNEDSFLLAKDVVYPWTPLGYGVPRNLPKGEVEVLTPKSTTLLMQQPMFTVSMESLVMRWGETLG